MAEGRWSRAVPWVIRSCCASGVPFPGLCIGLLPKLTPLTECRLGAVSRQASAFLENLSEVIETLNEAVSSLLKNREQLPSFLVYAVTFPPTFRSTPSIVAPENCWATSMA